MPRLRRILNHFNNSEELRFVDGDILFLSKQAALNSFSNILGPDTTDTRVDVAAGASLDFNDFSNDELDVSATAEAFVASISETNQQAVRWRAEHSLFQVKAHPACTLSQTAAQPTPAAASTKPCRLRLNRRDALLQATAAQSTLAASAEAAASALDGFSAVADQANATLVSLGLSNGAADATPVSDLLGDTVNLGGFLATCATGGLCVCANRAPQGALDVRFRVTAGAPPPPAPPPPAPASAYFAWLAVAAPRQAAAPPPPRGLFAQPSAAPAPPQQVASEPLVLGGGYMIPGVMVRAAWMQHRLMCVRASC